MSANQLKTEQEIAALRESGRMLATVLDIMKRETVAGRTPKDMSAIARQKLQELGGEPAFLGYYGYPDIICISVNNQVQHSIPNNIALKNGDVVNYDFGVRWQGMITDAGITVCVGDGLNPDTKRLLTGTERALYDGLRVVRAGARVGDISAAVERTLRKYKLGIVRELVGHGVGQELHEDPEIPNYGHAGRGSVLRAGMTIAVEPITTLGDPGIYQARDGWTLLTRDGSWSAQFEHTVLVTATGCEVLTQL
jgi:methionyl aminopeptidase